MPNICRNWGCFKILTQPTPTPSDLAANHRFCTAQQVEYRSVSWIEFRPKTTSAPVVYLYGNDSRKAWI
jgi:hypothetical protein